MRHHVIRVFFPPIGPIEPRSGQPWKKYAGWCLVTTFKRRGYVHAVLEVPRGGFDLLRHDVARRLKLKRMYGLRWDEKRQKKRWVEIPLR